jgi:hypothetical protein
VRLRDVAGLGQQQSHGVLGRRDDVALRRVDHHHPPTGCRLDIDVVEPDARSADHDQLIGNLQDLRGDLRRRPNDQALCTANVGRKCVEIETDIDIVPGGAQAIEPAFSDFFGNKDPCHCVHRYRLIRGLEKN